MHPFLELLQVLPTPAGECIAVSPEWNSEMLPVLKAFNKAKAEGTILSVDFQTVNDYLWLLRAATSVMAPIGRRGMFYLAAAVSDFFLPEDRVVSSNLSAALTPGRAQDPVDQGLALARDGPGPQGPPPAGPAVDPRGLHCLIQGKPTPINTHQHHSSKPTTRFSFPKPAPPWPATAISS